MANLYNFNKNITNIIKLKQNGFKKKGNHFFNIFQDYIEEIFIHSSSWNSSYSPSNEFFINLYLIKDNKWIIQERIPNKPNYDKPKRFNEFYNVDLFDGDWGKRDEAFSNEERAEIYRYQSFLAWRYKNEDDLIKLFEIASEVIINYGLKYFKEVEKNIIEDKILNREENKIIFNNIFYWK
jgi:hypothetical protein